MTGLLQSLIKVKSKLDLEIAPVTEKGQSHLKYNYGILNQPIGARKRSFLLFSPSGVTCMIEINRLRN